MRPEYLENTRIFLDGADPEETRQVIAKLGFLDGQTTNPSLLAKNPAAQQHKTPGHKFSRAAIYEFYKDLCRTLTGMLPDGSISIEVYADAHTDAGAMCRQGREFASWIPNAWIKLPSSAAGLEAAEILAGEGVRVNMTLCFSQAQAAATYAATRGSMRGEVFVSPFIGRLDDRGENGMDLIANIMKMYKAGDGHVQVLTASVRSMEHFLCALAYGSDIITAPYKLLMEWGERGMPMAGPDYAYNPGSLKPIPYKELDLNKPWREYDITHPLTDAGMEKFSTDWNSLIDMSS